jgi:sugar phosphate isomerase/epimerase
MTYPKLACPNLFSDVGTLKSFAMDYGFQGIDWTMRPEDVPRNPLEYARLANALTRLAPLEIRYHLFFKGTELGDADPANARTAQETFDRALQVISRLSARFVTVHLGLGRESMQGISWDKTLTGLTDLAAAGGSMGIRVCLENLIWGWTAQPDLYEKLVRQTGCWGTLDIGHAQVCESVMSRLHDVGDFAWPNPTRILNAHIYHEETSEGHIPPVHYTDLEQRLRLLSDLPLCDWWVLELREEKALLQTLGCVKEFLRINAACAAM